MTCFESWNYFLLNNSLLRRPINYDLWISTWLKKRKQEKKLWLIKNTKKYEKVNKNWKWEKIYHAKFEMRRAFFPWTQMIIRLNQLYSISANACRKHFRIFSNVITRYYASSFLFSNNWWTNLFLYRRNFIDQMSILIVY